MSQERFKIKIVSYRGRFSQLETDMSQSISITYIAYGWPWHFKQMTLKSRAVVNQRNPWATKIQQTQGTINWSMMGNEEIQRCMLF
jgi:hypothetical protein